MALTSMIPLLRDAEKGIYAVPAFNINTDLHAEAIFWAANELRSPIIVQASKGACVFQGNPRDPKKPTLAEISRGARRIRQICDAVSQDYPEVDYALHLDHGTDIEIIKGCIDAGFTSVMFDGSEYGLEQNADITHRVVQYAHERGVSVEGELGTLGGASHAGGTEDITYTDPKQVQYFVRESGVDALAVCWGTRHGPNKFFDGNMDLRPEVIKECYDMLKAEVGETYLVSHGSSTVPQRYVDEINSNGGLVKTSGVPQEMIDRIINYGARKINIDTDLRLAMTGAIRQVLSENKGTIDPRDYLVPARRAVYGAAKILSGCFIQRGGYDIQYTEISE